MSLVLNLDSVAISINEEHRACEASSRRAVQHAVNAGRMLIEAKAQLDHGHWEDWRNEHFEGSSRTAQLYMQMANSPEVEAKAQHVADFTFADARAIVSTPKPKPEPRADVISVLRGEADTRSPTIEQSVTLTVRTTATPATVEAIWSMPQTRKWHHVYDMLEAVRTRLEEAKAGGLSPHSISELLREASVIAKDTGPLIEELAFGFER